jgi:hypothetical protein
VALYGISGSPTTEACPLNNDTSAKRVLHAEDLDIGQIAQKYKISKIVGQYHSALEHTFLWIVKAEDPGEQHHKMNKMIQVSQDISEWSIPVPEEFNQDTMKDLKSQVITLGAVLDAVDPENQLSIISQHWNCQ